MAVLINGMEMPKSCEECQTVLGRCDELEDGTVWCRMAHGYIGDERTVCPLVPVPPHGDLIDRDAIRAEVKKHAEPSDAWVLGLIRTAPTIIPAVEDMAWTTS